MEILKSKLKFLTLLFLCSALVFFYSISILTMSMGSMSMGSLMHHASITGKSLVSPTPISDTEQCVNFHLSFLSKIFQSIPQMPVVAMLATVVLLGFIVRNYTKQILHHLQTLLLIKHQRLKPISLFAFITQLGSWLTIIHQKAPAYAFAIA